MSMSKGHVQEKKNEIGQIIAYRAVIPNPHKLTKSGTPKRESCQFAVERQPGDRTGIGHTPAQAKKAAEDWLHNTRQAFIQGKTSVARSAMSLSDAADEWLEAIQIEGNTGRGALRSATLTYYDFLVRCYIHEPPAGVLDLGVLRLTELKHSNIEDWKLDLIEQVSRSIALRALQALKQILRYSKGREWIETNPASDVKLGSEKNKDESITILLQRGHVKAMLKLGKELLEKGYIGDKEPETRLDKSNAWQRKKMMESLYPLLRLGFASGARSGELLAAQAWDFNFDHNTFRIERTLTREGELGPPKTKRGYRTLAIDADSMSYVKARIEKLGLKKDALVFGSRTGKKVTGSNLYRSWKRFLAVIDPFLDEDLEPLILPDGSAITSPYHSRHYHASELLQVGVSLGDVSERLGHADTVITQKHYAYLLGDRAQASRAASDRFAAIFSEAAE